MLSLLAAFTLQASQHQDYTKDLDQLVSDLKEYGAYVESDKIDFKQLDAAYRPKFAAATPPTFLPLLESFVAELRDFHAFIGSNDGASPRLVPSGTDVVGFWRGDQAIIDQVRPGSFADKAGLRAGEQVVEIDGKPVRLAAQGWLGVRPADPRGWDWALNSALAGRWNAPRSISIASNRIVSKVQLPTAKAAEQGSRLTIEKRSGGVIYLRPEDSLGQNDLLKDFDKCLPDLRSAKGVILDLRNTPSGGNTSVARGIMGLFIDKRLPYQRHVVVERATDTVRDWVEYASPRLDQPIRAKLIVLVSRWTGSMGEGIAIGFDAMKRGTVVGTAMAGLRGAVDSTTLPTSGLRVFFPTEQLFHINGTPRHEWLPPVRVKPGPGDPWMTAADRRLSSP